MATPVGDSYGVASGGVIAAGRYHRPLWRREMAANTWRTIPASNKLSSLNPTQNASLNPNYPSAGPWDASGGHSGVVSAWCGAAYDQANDVLWLPLQGGHADYAGNEPYKISLNADTPAWVMVRPPSGAIGNTGTLNDGLESTGIYFDGRPRAIHSANRNIYVPSVGPMTVMQGLVSFSAGNGTAKAIKYNETTGEATFLASNPWGGLFSGGMNGGTAYDPVRNCLWYLASFNGAKLAKYDIASDTWSQVGATTPSSGNAMFYVPVDDLLVSVCSGFSGSIGVFDIAAATWSYPGTSGSVVGGADLSANTYGRTAPIWVPSLNAAAFWDNSSSTTVINSLNKPSNPKTTAWTISQLPVSGSNAVTPTARTAQGTYSRFQYSSRLNGFVLLNATNQDIYFYALD